MNTIQTGKMVMINKERLRFANNPGTVKINEDRIIVLDGNWDLATNSFASGASNGSSVVAYDPLPVFIGRDGDPIVMNAPADLNMHSGEVAVVVVGRHREWQDFIDEIHHRLLHEEDRLAYTPLTHFDLADIASWNKSDRPEMIIPHISPNSKTVLDIGAHWGYMCEQLETQGLTCTAVEAEAYDYYFMRKLKRAGAYNYTAVYSDIFDFVKPGQQYDVVLSLAIFHHFIKKKATHDKLQQMLKDIDMNEMFFWAHNVEEPQMRNAYKNYEPDEFAAFIISNSCLNHYEIIGEVEYRNLYRLWK
jgi:Methyltransferase domain